MRWMEPEPDQVRLTGVRAEFRSALTEEIEAARKAASNSAVALLNGRRIAQVASSFQYAFNVEWYSNCRKTLQENSERRARHP